MWDLGESVTSDEAARGFKGKDSKKSIIKYKREVGGYIIDCVDNGGFIYTFFLRTTPDPKNWCAKGFGPAQEIVLFFWLKTEWMILYVVWGSEFW